MGKRINGGVDNQGFRLGAQNKGINNGDIRHQGAGDDGHLDLALRIGDDAELTDVRTAPRSGGDQQHGRQRTGYPVGALVIRDFSAIAGQNGYPLGSIEHAAAADGDNHIRAVFDIELGALFHHVIAGIRGNARVVHPAYAFLVKDVLQALQPASFFNTGITNHKGLLGAQATGALPGIVETATAKNNFRDGKFGDIHCQTSIFPAKISHCSTHPIRSSISYLDSYSTTSDSQPVILNENNENNSPLSNDG